MKIAVLSGKGGTGKTTVSVSLAASLKQCQFIDCDVEEPNAAIFLKPELEKSFPVKVPVPVIDEKKCDACGQCAKNCQFNALAVLQNKVLVFEELCHHCGTCSISCTRDAITETYRTIGVIEQDKSGSFLHGKLNIGEPLCIPVLEDLKKHMKHDIPVIVDCPPGASCSVIHSIEVSDYCLLVAEPTPFGFNDFKTVVQLLKKMQVPFGVVINKSDEDQCITDYCRKKDIDILLEIPYSRKFAEAYSKGSLPFQDDTKLKDKFKNLYQKIVDLRSVKI